MTPIRIAMWSGPRNISTAMMRAWGNRSDTAVIDEPFYGYYLEQTGKNHPMASEIIAAGETNWRKVAAHLATDPIPDGKRIFFQKQMTHHLLPEVDRDWMTSLTNCFLIRDPREVILSYIQKNPNPAVEDLGFVQQREIFEFIRERTGSIPAVIDAKDVLENPKHILTLLCDAIGLPFENAMVSWPAGLRETDGIWAQHWYDAVAESTSFGPYRASEGTIPTQLAPIYEECRKRYEELYQHRLR